MKKMIEFNGEQVGLLSFGIQNCLGRIAILFWSVFTHPKLKIFFVKKILDYEGG